VRQHCRPPPAVIRLPWKEDVLRAKAVERMRRPEEAGNWSRRYKLNLEKLASEDPASVSEVIVDLELQDRETGLSAGERRMLDRAWTLRRLLRSE
jgi:CarD family transcriptional regulator